MPIQFATRNWWTPRMARKVTCHVFTQSVVIQSYQYSLPLVSKKVLAP